MQGLQHPRVICSSTALEGATVLLTFGSGYFCFERVQTEEINKSNTALNNNPLFCFLCVCRARVGRAAVFANRLQVIAARELQQWWFTPARVHFRDY